ncbi:MAG: O-antigen ligase family protein [Candidatus Moraniibacteriota bacterium]
MSTLLSLFFLFLPFQFALQPTASLDMASIRVFSILLFLGWIFIALLRRKLFFPAHPVTFLLLSWFALVVLSIFFSREPLWGWRKLFFLLSFLPLFFVFTDTCKKYPTSFSRVLTSFTLGASISAGIAILQWLLQWTLGLDPLIRLWTHFVWPFFLGTDLSTMVARYPSFLVNIHGHTLFRAVGLLPDPHIASFFFGMALPCALALGFSSHSLRRITWFCAAGILLLADLLSFSRGGYTGLFFAGCIGLIWFVGQRLIIHKNTSAYPWLKTTLFIVCFILFFTSSFGSRLLSSFSLTDNSNQGRLAMWSRASSAITTHPWLGVGLGNFPLFVNPTTTYRTPIYAHNLWLDISAESGIFADLLFFALIILAVVSLFRIGQQNILFLGPGFGLLVFFGHSFFETTLFSVHILPILILFLALSTLSPSLVARKTTL